MLDPGSCPRHVERRLAEALKDSPVVLIRGSRQCGELHFRDRDSIIKQTYRAGARVEVKAVATVTAADFRGLRKPAAAAADRFAHGAVLFDGEVSMRFGERLYAVPIRRLWETS